jgi:hypothetical protein
MICTLLCRLLNNNNADADFPPSSPILENARGPDDVAVAAAAPTTEKLLQVVVKRLFLSIQLCVFFFESKNRMEIDIDA